MPALRILRFARTRRCAIVGSGTRNARAISAVVSPASVRSVSATCASTRQRRVAAREDQPQPVVVDAARRRVRPGSSGGRQHRDLLQLGGARRGAAQPVERAVARGGREPRAGIARDAVARPPLERAREGVLRALLGEIPVAGDPDQRRDDAAPLVAERVGDGGLDVGRYISQIGRTSIEPCCAPGIFDATSIASSRSLQSTR